MQEAKDAVVAAGESGLGEKATTTTTTKPKTLSKAELAKLLLSDHDGTVGTGGEDDDEGGGLSSVAAASLLGDASSLAGKSKDKVKRTRMQNQKGTATMYIKP